MIAYVCPSCGAVADPFNADESWRFSATGTLVEHVHDGIRSCCRKVEVVAAPLSREGWRPRLAVVEALLAAHAADHLPDETDPDVLDALALVRALLDGDANTEGLVRLDAEEFAEIESWRNSCAGEGWETDDDLLDRLRREVGA